MPQLLVTALVSLGVSTLVATAIVTAVFIAASLLFRPGGGSKPDQSERTIRDPKPPRVFIAGTRRSYGAQHLFTNASDGSTVDVWAYADAGGPGMQAADGIVQAYLNDDPITVSGGVVQPLADGAYEGGWVNAGWNLGLPTETAHAPVVAKVPTEWTAAHRGDGICSGYLIKQPVKGEDFLDVYPQGDNVTMSLVLRGVRMHDPRNPASDPYAPATWAYSDNAALIHMWFRLVIKGDDYNDKFLPHEDLWIAAADDCDEAYALAAGGTEPKYRAWVIFDSTAEPAAVEDEIRACYDGWTAPDENGALKVYSGKLYEPTVSIGDAEIIDYTLQDGLEEENRINEIIVRHISAAHDYLEVECDPWRDESDIAARGAVLTTGLDLQVPSHTQARRLAKRKMAKVDAPQRGRVRVTHTGRIALTERYINLSIVEAGVTFFEGVVEVIGGERDGETGGATVEWLAVDPNVDTWNAVGEDGETAPTQTKTYLPPLETPAIDDAVAEVDTGSTARVAISFTAPAAAGTTWLTRWRLAGGVSWVVEQHSDVATGPLRTGSVPLDESIEVAISYVGSGGRSSEWSTTETVSTSSAGLAPAPNGSFTATGGAGEATGSWSNSSSANFGHSELWGGPTAAFGDASQLGADYGGEAGTLETFTEPLAAGTWYLWTVAFNAAGSASSRTGPLMVTVT